MVSLNDSSLGNVSKTSRVKLVMKQLATGYWVGDHPYITSENMGEWMDGSRKLPVLLMFITVFMHGLLNRWTSQYD